jgi:hypothetical protein
MLHFYSNCKNTKKFERRQNRMNDKNIIFTAVTKQKVLKVKKRIIDMKFCILTVTIKDKQVPSKKKTE